MNGTFLLFGRDEIENSFMHFIDRQIREQRRGERQLAEQRTTKHRFQARKSCIADARSYRIARRLSAPHCTEQAVRLFTGRVKRRAGDALYFLVAWIPSLRRKRGDNFFKTRVSPQRVPKR